MVFILSAFWWRRIRSLWKLPDGRDWPRGKLGLVLMCRAMLSKSLIQFSVDGPGCVPSLLFDLRPNSGGGNEDNGELHQKSPCMHCYTQCPRHCSRPPPTHTFAGDTWTLPGKPGSVSLGSLLLSPGSKCTQVSVCALKESVSPVLYTSWQLYCGLVATSYKGAYATPRAAAPRAPAPAAGRCWPIPSQETLKHSPVLVSVRVSAPWCAQGLFECSEYLWWVSGLIPNVISPLLPSYWGLSFAPGCGISFFVGSNILQSTVIQQQAAVWEFSQEKKSTLLLLLRVNHCTSQLS